MKLKHLLSALAIGAISMPTLLLFGCTEPEAGHEYSLKFSERGISLVA